MNYVIETNKTDEIGTHWIYEYVSDEHLGNIVVGDTISIIDYVDKCVIRKEYHVWKREIRYWKAQNHTEIVLSCYENLPKIQKEKGE